MHLACPGPTSFLFGGHENNSERPLCIVHAPAQLVFFLVNMCTSRACVCVCDIEWAMSTSPLRTGVHSALVLHWHRRVLLPAQPCCAHSAVLRGEGSGPPLPALVTAPGETRTNIRLRSGAGQPRRGGPARRSGYERQRSRADRSRCPPADSASTQAYAYSSPSCHTMARLDH